MLCNVKIDMKVNIQYNSKNTRSEVGHIQYDIFSSFILSCFCKNNHGCLSVMQSLQYKNLYKAVSPARADKDRQKSIERQIKVVGKE